MKKFISILMATLLMFSLAACSSTPEGEAAAEAKTKLVLGTSADYPPFEFIVLNENGEKEYAGIDISFSKKLAEDAGLELEIVNMSFDNLMASLQKGEIDMVVAAIEETEERANVASFSNPYYTDLPPMILVKAENADSFTSIEDFEGKTVGAQMGTSKAEIVTSDMPQATLLAMSAVNDLVNNVVYDKCDAIVLDGAVAMKYAANDENLVIADVNLGEAYPYSVAVKKDDPLGLLDTFNKTIEAITQDGSMDTWIVEADALSSQAVE